ncbi:hypothetical protein EVAR_71140_1 [Eumeta japonica]|uniref:Uncharacterized protein n=1 Tax=Eumeta variegata TaxID=151549 RepID=A0A4C2ACR2_EUMVA|nr:hypothetical protein EVAR_71140_1 [Eumeta japonica]
MAQCTPIRCTVPRQPYSTRKRPAARGRSPTPEALSARNFALMFPAHCSRRFIIHAAPQSRPPRRIDGCAVPARSLSMARFDLEQFWTGSSIGTPVRNIIRFVSERSE